MPHAGRGTNVGFLRSEKGSAKTGLVSLGICGKANQLFSIRAQLKDRFGPFLTRRFWQRVFVIDASSGEIAIRVSTIEVTSLVVGVERMLEIKMNSEYRLVVFKGFVTFVFVGIVGFVIENLHSASQVKRDRERVLLEASYGHLADFGASLSFLRATVSRMSAGQAATSANLSDYRMAFRQFSESKVSFILGVEQLGITDSKLISAFGELNESAIKMDRCNLGARGSDCMLQEDFQRFVKLSTSFEFGMVQILATSD